MPTIRPASTARIRKLLEDGTRTLGLRLVFHDRLWRSGLPHKWRHHTCAPCRAKMKVDEQRCFQFCMRQVHTELAGQPDGRMHTCPWGFTEIAVPVTDGGLFAGILFAGPAWLGRRKPPYAELVNAPSRAWLETRLTVLRALAERLGRLLEDDAPGNTGNRRAQVLGFLHARLDRRVSLAQLSAGVEEFGQSVREMLSQPPLAVPEIRALKKAAA